MAAPFTLRDRWDALVRHFRWTPRGALNADGLVSVLVCVACDQSARSKDVQGVGWLIDLRQVGRDHDDTGVGSSKIRLVEDEELGAVIEPLADQDLEGASRAETLAHLV